MENSSNNNWLTLLRRKIQRKFKRSRQKASNVEDVAQEPAEEVNQNPDAIAAAEENVDTTTTANELNSLSHNCEDMKRELYKLSWYWPNLRYKYP